MSWIATLLVGLFGSLAVMLGFIYGVWAVIAVFTLIEGALGREWVIVLAVAPFSLFCGILMAHWYAQRSRIPEES